MQIPKKILDEFEAYCKKNGMMGKEKDEKFAALKQKLAKYFYEPGEAIGIVAAQSISEPATQMSTSPYEKIILKRNGAISVIEIGKFIDAIVEEMGKTVDKWDVADISSAGIYAPSINEEEKIEWKKVLAVSRHSVPKKMLKLTTFSGREIVATDSHSFITRRNNKIMPIAGSELTMNDRISVMKYLPENCIDTINIRDFITGPLKERSNTLDLDYNFGWLIGAYLSEGSCNGSQIAISNISSGILSKFFISTCGAGSSKKRVPQFAYSAKEEFVAGLLKGYFDGDGDHGERNLIRVSSNSKELIDGISLLLARFGIFAYKKRNKHQYGLLIPYKYAPIFLAKIGSDISKKRIGLEKIASEKNTDISSEINLMRRMFSSDVVWDRITSMEYIKPDFDYVYDLTVEGTQTFTTFDGIITHNTMRSYTLASQSDRLSKVTHGLPRLIEIFDARKTFEKKMVIYLKPEYNTKEKAKELAGKIKALKLGDIILSDSIDLINMRLEFELEKESDKDRIKEMLEKYAKDASVSFKGRLVYVTPKKNTMKDLRKLKGKIMKVHTGGVKGIENVVVIKESDDWVIQTTGTNLKKVLRMEEVDVARTSTNDIYQVYDVLGVEAARNVILKEARQTLEEQGLDVDVRHLMLLADMMTFDGTIKDIGRYGVSGKKASVLARANFEETKKHLINASFYGEKDTLEGIIENIIVGQIAPIGTGMVKLAVDVEKLRAGAKKK